MFKEDFKVEQHYICSTTQFLSLTFKVQRKEDEGR